MEEKQRQANKKLRRERELRGWSQRALAEMIGTSEQVFNRWEAGQHKPNRYFQTQLCQLFGKNAEELGFMGEAKTEVQEAPPPSAQDLFREHLLFLDQSIPLPLSQEQCDTNDAAMKKSLPHIKPAMFPISPLLHPDSEDLPVPNREQHFSSGLVEGEMFNVTTTSVFDRLVGARQFQDQGHHDEDVMKIRRPILRELFMIGCTALVTSPYAVLYHDGNEQLNLSVLEELQMITTSYWRLCTNTSLDLLGNLSEHFRTVVTLLQRMLPHHIAQQLCSLSGEIAQLLGKTLFDLREYTLAWSFYMFSLKAAQAAGNHPLWAAGIGRMILLLIYWEAPQKALPLLQEAKQLHIQDRSVVCWLAAVEAEVYACLGDADLCIGALHRAKKYSGNDAQTEDRYALGLNSSRLAGYEGACFLRLRQPERALIALQQALAFAEPDAIRRRSRLITDIGIAYAQLGKINKAYELASKALSLTTQTKSRDVLERVSVLLHELAAWKETDVVKHLEQQFNSTFILISA